MILIDFNNTGKGLAERLARPVNIFRTFHTLTGGYFLTLSMFWGHTVGHLSHVDLLIITASELCVESPKQRSAVKCTSLCP